MSPQARPARRRTSSAALQGCRASAGLNACATFVIAFLTIAATNTTTCGPATPTTLSPAPLPTPGPNATIYTTSDGVRFFVDTVASNVEVPWSLAFAPDGRLFFTERPGRVRVVQNGTLISQPALTLSDVVVFSGGESGALGIALHPNFAQNHYVYVAYTGTDAGDTPVNRLVRFRETNNTLADSVVILDNLNAASIHDGSRVKFGPDGLLYMTMGDAATADNAQNLAIYNGKILRLNDDGTTPRANPFSSPVFSLGHRNPQGLDWHPATGDLWETEHGNIRNDEVNVIEAGKNYGWPVIEADQTRAGMETPITFYNPSIAPSGAAFYRGSAFPAFQNNFFFATLRGLHLHRLRLDPANPRRIAAEERLVENVYGRIRDVVSGPDGFLYISTSNRDGRNTPTAADDQILRLVPVNSQGSTFSAQR
jgi:glucose/arabinose dehydrogenase